MVIFSKSVYHIEKVTDESRFDEGELEKYEVIYESSFTLSSFLNII